MSALKLIGRRATISQEGVCPKPSRKGRHGMDGDGPSPAPLRALGRTCSKHPWLRRP